MITLWFRGVRQATMKWICRQPSVLPSIVADEPASDRRRSKLSVVSVQISLENANPHFLDADGRNYQSHDISMPCDSAYWPNSPDVIIKIILEAPFWWSMSTCVIQSIHALCSEKCALFLGNATFIRKPIDHQHGERGISCRVWRACKGST